MNIDNKVTDPAQKAAEAIDKLMQPLTDRARVIVAFSRLDRALTEAVAKRMVPPASKRTKENFQKQLEPDGIFGSTKAKLMLAHALGVLGPRMYGEIDTLRELRNLFAHNEHFPAKPSKYAPYAGQHIDLSHPYVSQVCNSLSHLESVLKRMGREVVLADARARFLLTTKWYEDYIRLISEDIEALEPAKGE